MNKELWVNKFEVIGIVPGKVIFLGKILDLSDENLPIERVQKLFDSGCKYLKLKDTDEPDQDSKGAELVNGAVSDVVEKLNDLESDPKKKIKFKKQSNKENPS